MNKTHRTVWSEARQAYVVTHEKAAARGKPSSVSRNVAQTAVAAALAAMAAGAAAAPTAPFTTTISNAQASAHQLSNYESLVVANSGSVSVSGSIGVRGNTISGGFLSNSGLISSGGLGVYLTGSTLSGGLTNSGNIGGAFQGIVIDSNSAIRGGLTNSGSIGGSSVGMSFSRSTLSGGLTNSGTISGGRLGAIFVYAGSIDSIVIAGNDTARFNGAVTTSGTSVPMFIASGATYTLRSSDRFVVASFTNNGTAQFDATTPSFSVANVGDRSFHNAGTLRVAANQNATIAGNLANTGTLSVGVTDMSHYGRLNVTGNTTLGGTLFVDAASATDLAAGTLSGVISAGTLSGSFASHGDNSSLFDFVPVYNGNSVDLRLQAAASNGVTAAVTAGGGGASAGGAAAALDQILQDNTNPITNLFVPVSAKGNAAIAEAVKETLPLLTGGTAAATTSAIGSINKVVQARMDSNRGMSSGDSFFADRHLWFKPFASWADQDNKSGISGYKSNLSGAAFGGDGMVGDNDRLGVAIAYANADVKSNGGGANRAKVDVYQLIGYGSHSIDANTEVSYQADIGSNINRGHRTIDFAGTTATSNYRSTSYHLGVGLSRSFALSEATSLTPSIRADYTHVRDNGYSENGAGALNLNVSAHTTEEMLWSADLKLAHKLKDSLTLVANGGVAYDSKAKTSSVTAAYAGAPGMGFTTTGIKPDATTFRGGIGLVSTPENGPEITGRYDVEARSGYTNQTVSAKVRWVF